VLQKLLRLSANDLSLNKPESSLEIFLQEFMVLFCIILEQFLFLLHDLFTSWVFTEFVLEAA